MVGTKVSTTPLPAASVVAAAYNAGATIATCIDSLLAQSYPSELLEIVVVDNGSRDRTRTVLDRFGDAITLVEEPLRGPGAARNAGIRRARGEVVAFLDADSVAAPAWLRTLVAALDDPAVGIAGGPILAWEPTNGAERFGERIHDHERALTGTPPYAATGNWASRREVLEEAGLFDSRLKRCSDVDLSYRIGARDYVLAYCAEAVVYHRNERSLGGLFREGWQHGFYAVPVRRRHSSYIASTQLQALHRSEGQPAEPPVEAGGEPEQRSRYRLAFESGKRLGRAMGQVRFAGRAAPASAAVDGLAME